MSIDTSSLLSAPWYKGEGDEQAHKIKSAFADLSKILRSLSQVPLSVTSLIATSPALRHTQLYPEQQYSNTVTGRPVRVHEIVGKFEASGKWPEDVRAILRLRTAFYLAIKEELKSLHITAKVNPDYLDIARDGFIFRLRFFVQKEAKLRDSNISFWQPSTGEELRCQMERTPYVTAHLGSLCSEHPAMPLTARLTPPSDLNRRILPPVVPPASHDWQLYPLVLNFREELSTELLTKLDNFITDRKQYPSAAIVCPGNEGSELTVASPDKRTLGLLTRLAEQSLKHTGEMGEIFQSDLDHLVMP
eukprot:sb/3467269/